MTLKNKREHLKLCPCCKGNAEWVKMTTKEISLWQISCEHCGLATIPDEKKMCCLQYWNRRDDQYSAIIWWVLIVLFALIFIAIAFSLGLATGAGIMK